MGTKHTLTHTHHLFAQFRVVVLDGVLGGEITTASAPPGGVGALYSTVGMELTDYQNWLPCVRLYAIEFDSTMRGPSAVVVVGVHLGGEMGIGECVCVYVRIACTQRSITFACTRMQCAKVSVCGECGVSVCYAGKTVLRHRCK